MIKLIGINFDETDIKLIEQIKKETGISTVKDSVRWALRQAVKGENK